MTDARLALRDSELINTKGKPQHDPPPHNWVLVCLGVFRNAKPKRSLSISALWVVTH